MFEQEGEEIVDRLGLDQVVVVKDQEDRLRQAGQLVDQRGEQGFGRRWLGFGVGSWNPMDALVNFTMESDTATRLNLLYARDYKVWNDFRIFWKGFKNLGRNLTTSPIHSKLK